VVLLDELHKNGIYREIAQVRREGGRKGGREGGREGRREGRVGVYL